MGRCIKRGRNYRAKPIPVQFNGPKLNAAIKFEKGSRKRRGMKGALLLAQLWAGLLEKQEQCPDAGPVMDKGAYHIQGVEVLCCERGAVAN